VSIDHRGLVMLRFPALPILLGLVTSLAHGAARELPDAGPPVRPQVVLMTAAAEPVATLPRPVLAVAKVVDIEVVAAPMPALQTTSPASGFSAPSGAMTSGSGLLAGLAIVAWIVVRRPS
jgi:hypothetical protein